MILSGEDIKRYDLLLDADPKNMQAQGWDVRLDKVYRVVNKPYGEKIKEEVDYVGPYKILVEDFNKTWGNSGLCNYICQIWNKDGILSYYIPPNSSVLFKLMETVDLTRKAESHFKTECGYFNAYVLPKSSLSRRGVIVHSAWWDAGYKGSGVVLVRTSEVPLQIKPGDAFGQMIFYEGSSTGSVYDGQYQGEGLAGRKV
jgi:deoxycytidine triphosphate deaminase